MTLLTPYTIHDADLALYPAWQDGMPMHGPGVGLPPAPVFLAKGNVTLSETRAKSLEKAHNWIGHEHNRSTEYDISVAFPDGAFSDDLSRVPSRLAVGGFHILVVRFFDASGEWSCFRFFYVTADADEAAASGEIMERSLRLKSTHLQETVGTLQPPSMAPVVLGEVDWVCGSQSITCLTYDPATETWASTDRNETGDGTRYVNFSPVAGSANDVALCAYFPRVGPGDQVPPFLPQAKVVWTNIVLANIGNQDSSVHHGLALAPGISLQAVGIPEPLLACPQSRMLDEPVLVFRYLRRIYATLGHGVLAVPALACDAAMPFTHDPPFRLAIPGDPNPLTGQSGLTLYPESAYLDGTLLSLT